MPEEGTPGFLWVLPFSERVCPQSKGAPHSHGLLEACKSLAVSEGFWDWTVLEFPGPGTVIMYAD